MSIFEQIEEHFKNSDETIGIYEERPGKEIVFMFNIYKSDGPINALNYLNKPMIGNSKIV